MAKGKKTKKAQKNTITLKVAENCVALTRDSKRRLDLSFKEVAVVPKCIQKLCEMDELDLSRNLIRVVPDFIDSFISICVLDLHSNYLEQLPVTIGRLHNLLVLNLCNNRLTSLPDELGLLKDLRTLNLCINRLDALPSTVGALQKLRRLGLSDNRFTRIPRCLSRLTKLESINLDRNPLITKEAAAGHEDLAVTERLYLATESVLCEGCVKKCRAERKTLRGGKRGRDRGCLMTLDDPGERVGASRKK